MSDGYPNERRQAPYEYQCKHEGTIEVLKERDENLIKLMEQISVKMDVMVGQLQKIPLLEEKHDQYVRDHARLTATLAETDKRLITLIETVEREAKERHDAFQQRVHDRLDDFKGKHDELSAKFHRVFYIGTGLWLAFCGVIYMLGDRPLRALENWKSNTEQAMKNTAVIIDSQDRRLLDIERTMKGRR